MFWNFIKWWENIVSFLLFKISYITDRLGSLNCSFHPNDDLRVELRLRLTESLTGVEFLDIEFRPCLKAISFAVLMSMSRLGEEFLGAVDVEDLSCLPERISSISMALPDEWDLRGEVIVRSKTPWYASDPIWFLWLGEVVVRDLPFNMSHVTYLSLGLYKYP